MITSTGRRTFLVAAIAPIPAAAQLDRILSRIGGKGGSGDKTSGGLKEALSIGITNAVGILAKPDGYFKNEAVKILLPKSFKTVETGLKFAGMGGVLDQLVLGMNRAAEKAAPLAKNIFVDAIKQMTFTDAKNILTGGNTAATDFFKSTTTDKLTTAFKPPVSEAMAEVGVTKTYNEFLGRVQKMPLLRLEKLELDNYVVGKALDGLFYMVGQEEKKIRTDPAARVTGLLREVFGGR
ncbi:MAG: DUF4197 domain-containing protein [Candidatus Solibacter usitatus]|nr:DUF4197 domain-containing protein [Candidatus Solibacter usitatus]